MTAVTIELENLDLAMPMAMLVDAAGRVTHVGPTLARISPGARGAMLREVLRMVQPALPSDPARLHDFAGRRIRVDLLREANRREDEAPSALRCLPIPLDDGRLLLNLSFGADPAVALRRHGLTAQDFSETDPTVDLLFLLEAHGVVLSEFQRLGDRLDRARAAAEEEAATDRLTGLRNRRAMDLHLEQLADGGTRPFGLMQLDLDYFKRVNDTFGHAAGDRVLQEVARILQEEVRRGDMVARVGGDEFMLVIENCNDIDTLHGVAARVIERLELPIDWEGNECRISGSIGMATSWLYDRVRPARLIEDADAALYEAKRAGRGTHVVAAPHDREGRVA